VNAQVRQILGLGAELSRIKQQSGNVLGDRIAFELFG